MLDAGNIIELARSAKIVYSGEVIVSVQCIGNVLYTYFMLGIERDNPSILELESNTDYLSFILQGNNIIEISENTYIINRYDIYDVIDIFGNSLSKDEIHVTSQCTDIDDAKTIGYILSILAEYNKVIYHEKLSINQIEPIITILDIIKEESGSSNTSNILFHLTIASAADYVEILEIFKNLFTKSLRKFDKNIHFDLEFGSDINPVLCITIKSQHTYMHNDNNQGDFKINRGLVYPDYEW